MHATRNTIEKLRALARRLDVRPAELLKMAREAEHETGLVAIEYLTNAGAAQLERDLLRMETDLRWFNQETKPQTMRV